MLLVVNHAVFIFVIAALIAILLNPIVRAFCALRVPRGLSVLLVYLTAALVLLGVIVILGTIVTNESQVAIDRVDAEFTSKTPQGLTPAEVKLARLQHWIDTSSPYQFDIRTPGERVVHDVSSLDLQQYTGQAVSIAQDLVIVIFESLFNLVLVIVISVYMLLDAPRLSRFLRRVFHSTDPFGRPDGPHRAGVAGVCPRPDAGVAHDRRDRHGGDVAARDHRRVSLG